VREELRPNAETAPWTSALPSDDEEAGSLPALRRETPVAKNGRTEEFSSQSEQRTTSTAETTDSQPSAREDQALPVDNSQAKQEAPIEIERRKRDETRRQAFMKSVLISETPGPARKGRSRGCPTTRPSSNGVRRAT
jgi:hypothetical protein